MCSQYILQSGKSPGGDSEFTDISRGAYQPHHNGGYDNDNGDDDDEHDYNNLRWKQVDTYSMSHLRPASQPNTETLQNTLAAPSRNSVPPKTLSDSQIKFIVLHCRTAGVMHALEIGTLGGYSAIWMASENPQLHVTIFEYDEHYGSLARRNIAAAGLESQIEVFPGDGMDALAQLLREVQMGERTQFGFVFMDAKEENSWGYFQLAKDMVRPNSVICVENVVRGGDLVDVDDAGWSVRDSREVVEKAGKESGVDAVNLQTVGEKGYNGWLWAVIS